MARRRFSFTEANTLVARLQAAVAFEQEVTLSVDDIELLVWCMERLSYNARRR